MSGSIGWLRDRDVSIRVRYDVYAEWAPEEIPRFLFARAGEEGVLRIDAATPDRPWDEATVTLADTYPIGHVSVGERRGLFYQQGMWVGLRLDDELSEDLERRQ